jgi:hypothetical protein
MEVTIRPMTSSGVRCVHYIQTIGALVVASSLVHCCFVEKEVREEVKEVMEKEKIT